MVPVARRWAADRDVGAKAQWTAPQGVQEGVPPPSQPAPAPGPAAPGPAPGPAAAHAAAGRSHRQRGQGCVCCRRTKKAPQKEEGA